MNKRTNKKTGWLLKPLFGSLLFIILYLLAASLYPGGSQASIHSKGFSWLHNYWCNLLNETAMNGEPNRGRYIANIAMIVLSLTMISFWMVAAYTMPLKKWVKNSVLISGGIAILLFPFLPTAYHDTIINGAGSFAMIAMAGVYYGIYKNSWNSLFAFGIFNLLLGALNNYLYYSAGGLYYLPLVQKITFLSVLCWICLVDIRLYRCTENPSFQS